jgi:hypothetical protein
MKHLLLDFGGVVLKSPFEPPGDRLLHREMSDLIRERHADGGVVGCLTNDMQAFQNAPDL